MAKANLNELVQEVIGRAKAAPDPEPILRHAANKFARLAMAPENARFSAQLKNVAVGFAKAASAPPRRATVSDFVDLLEETKATIQEVGDHNAMNIIARRREIHEERSTDAPRVSISPETFNEDSTLGRAATIKFNPSNDEIHRGIVQSQTVAFWQGKKRETQAISVDVALTNPPPPIILSDAHDVPDARPYGIVEYGADGNKVSVVFDVSLGVRLNVLGNYVSVLVGMGVPRILSPGPPIVYEESPTIVVGASLGAFASPSTAPVLRTLYLDDLGAGVTSPFLPIPDKAVLLLPLQTNQVLGETATIFFFGYGGGLPIYSVTYAQLAASPVRVVPITGDIRFVQVQNAGAAARNFRLPFQLSL